MPEDEAKKLAEAHWEFQERWLHMVFVDAFIHGFRHGKEVAEKDVKDA